jgi:DNA-binding GntR family transcriptional regulator
LISELERDPATGDPEHQLSLARQFDELLLAAADNTVVAGLIDSMSVFGWSLRVRAVRAMHKNPEVGLGRIRYHRQLLTALRERDPERVETLTRDHLIDSVEYILSQAR